MLLNSDVLGRVNQPNLVGLKNSHSNQPITCIEINPTHMAWVSGLYIHVLCLEKNLVFINYLNTFFIKLYSSYNILKLYSKFPSSSKLVLKISKSIKLKKLKQG